MDHSFSLSRAVLIAACCSAGAVAAQDVSPLSLNASYEVQSDDNLFRRPDGVNATAEQRSDRIGVGSLGVMFHTTQGLQKFELDASLVNYHYQNNSSLGFTARNYAGAWRWALTPRLQGNLTANRQERPDGGPDSPAPNQQIHTNYRADADYELDGPWHVVLGTSQEKAQIQSSSAAGQEFSSNAFDAGIRYDQTSGSFVKVSAKVANGTYLNDFPTAANSLDKKFQQIENTVNVHWALSSASAADVNATALARTHPTYALRDFSGLNWGGSLNWSLSAKTALKLAFQHDLAAFATSDINYSASDQRSWSWSWQPSAKTQVVLGQSFIQVGYHGSPFGAAESLRQDNIRNSSLSLVWTPRQQWQVRTTLRQISGNTDMQVPGYPALAGANYVSNQISLFAQFTY